MFSLVGQLVHLLQVTRLYRGAAHKGAVVLDLPRAVDHIVEIVAASMRACEARDAGKDRP